MPFVCNGSCITKFQGRKKSRIFARKHQRNLKKCRTCVIYWPRERFVCCPCCGRKLAIRYNSKSRPPSVDALRVP